MKKIEATLESFRLDKVKEALLAIGIPGLTVSTVTTHGRRLERTESFRGANYVVDYVPEIVIEVVVDDFKVGQVVHAIRAVARSGQTCEGTIRIVPIDEAIRVRTGERGSSAL